MVALTTSLAGRVRNTNLPKSHSLMPLLEAVVNGLQAIDARLGDDIGQGRLRVKVERGAQEAFEFEPSGPGRAPLRPILGFSIEDNGVGFTPDNMSSFETLDTDFKAALGCRSCSSMPAPVNSRPSSDPTPNSQPAATPIPTPCTPTPFNASAAGNISLQIRLRLRRITRY